MRSSPLNRNNFHGIVPSRAKRKEEMARSAVKEKDRGCSMNKQERRAAQAEKDRLMDEKLLKDFNDPEKKKRRRRNVRIGWCITLAILLIASVVNWGIISSWGKVDITRVTIPGDDGAKYSGLVYRPDNATDENPAPAIIMFHGNAGNARNHESWAVEFARRGFVVVVPDLYGAGDSEGYFDGTLNKEDFILAGDGDQRALTDQADFFYRYMLQLPFVDDENIISSGHSMGNNAACGLGGKYDAKAILGASPGRYITEEFENYKHWAEYDGVIVTLTGDVELGKTEEARWDTTQQRALPVLHHYADYQDATEVQLNTEYGSIADGSGFIFISEPERIHEAAFVSTTTVGNLLKYGQEAIGDAVPNYIDANDQVWPIKDYTGLFGIFAWAAFAFATALLLIEEVPAFAAVKRPLARNVGFRGTALAIASLIGLLVPYLVIKTDAFGIVGGRIAYNLYSAGFNLGYSNMGFGIIIGLTIVCILGFIVFMLTERKKKGITADTLGLTPYNYSEKASRGDRMKAIAAMIVKSALVAAIAVAVGFVYMQLQLTLTGTDFYAWFFGVKDLPVDKIGSYLPYLAVFLVAFVFLSFDMNIIRRLPTTGNETKDLLIAMAVNLVIGIAMVIVIVAVKWWLQSMGSAADTGLIWNMALDTQRIWGMPVGMTVAVLGSTFVYKKTGNIWLCALLVGTVACIMGVLYGQTRFHYLTFVY